MTDEIPQDVSGLPALLTVDQVAARFSTSRDTVYRWVRSKSSTFPRPIPLPTSGIRWRADVLDAWERGEHGYRHSDGVAARLDQWERAKGQAAHSAGKAA